MQTAAGLSIINDIEIMVVSGASENDGSVDCDLYPGVQNYMDLWLFKIIDTVSVFSKEHNIDHLTISVYPNPAKNVMYYHIYPPQDNLTLRLFDIYGQKMDDLFLSKKESRLAWEFEIL